jgi:glycosyltransferase involved in cell wall biosynthesis
MTKNTEQNTPDISIIIPNRNYSYYIADALNSVLHQTFQNWECIVIDDGSTDDSVSVIQKFVDSDPRFRLFRNKKTLGTSVSRNIGLDNARGTYIAFLDSDDSYTQNALETLFKLAQQTGAPMVGGHANIVPVSFKYIPQEQVPVADTNNFKTIYNPAVLLQANQNHKWCWIWRRIYHRALIGDVRFSTKFTSQGEDLAFMMDILYRSHPTIETPVPVVNHRYHDEAMTNMNKLDETYFDWFPHYFEHLRDNSLDKYDAEFLRQTYRAAFAYLLMETISRPRKFNKLQMQARAVLIKSCKLIPRRYLTRKQRFLCWFLTCLK